MVLRALYVIELLDAEEGGIELVDPAWCELLLLRLSLSFFSNGTSRYHLGYWDRIRRRQHERCSLRI